MKASKKSQIIYKILNIISTNPNVAWTVDKITIRTGQTLSDTRFVLGELVHKSLLFINSRSYGITEEGSTTLSQFIKDPRLANSDNVRKFKEEAQSGLKIHRNKKSGNISTRKSEIDRAVIPKNKRVRISTRDSEICFEDLIDARRELANEKECELLDLDAWDDTNNQQLLERYERLVSQKLNKG